MEAEPVFPEMMDNDVDDIERIRAFIAANGRKPTALELNQMLLVDGARVSKEALVPSEYRRYVKPGEVPSGVQVHQGERGGTYVDARDLGGQDAVPNDAGETSSPPPIETPRLRYMLETIASAISDETGEKWSGVDVLDRMLDEERLSDIGLEYPTISEDDATRVERAARAWNDWGNDEYGTAWKYGRNIVLQDMPTDNYSSMLRKYSYIFARNIKEIEKVINGRYPKQAEKARKLLTTIGPIIENLADGVNSKLGQPNESGDIAEWNPWNPVPPGFAETMGGNLVEVEGPDVRPEDFVIPENWTMPESILRGEGGMAYVAYNEIPAVEDNDWRWGDKIEDIASALGMGEGEVFEYLDDVVSDIFERSSVWTRVGPETLLKVLRDGRFKNQHETATSKGIYDPDLRNDAEEMLFGDGVRNEKPATKPFYGYLTDREDGTDGHVGAYGDIAVKFKDDVKDRATACSSDSLDETMGSDAKLIPQPIRGGQGNHYYRALLVNYMMDITFGFVDRGPMGGRFPKPPDTVDMHEIAVSYWEAQIHGGITTDDIESVVMYGENPFLARILEDRGIPYRVENE